MTENLKAKVLAALRARSGEWVSGQDLSRDFGVSRMAVSKHVRALVAVGYHIESFTRKGYRFVSEPDVLLPSAVGPRLRGDLFLPKHYHFLPETDSTNDVAKQAALAGAPGGSVYAAEAQNKGRGRRGRVWFGQVGNSLTFSMLIRPKLAQRELTLLPLLTAVAIRDALVELAPGTRIGIKWPNDLLYDRRKLSGILCEIGSDLEQAQYAVIGVGINVNTPTAAFPEDIRDLACSFFTITGRKVHRADVLAGILYAFEQRLHQAMTEGFGPMRQLWTHHSVSVNRYVTVQQDQGALQGLSEGISDEGALLVRDAAGVLHTVHSGDLVT